MAPPSSFVVKDSRLGSGVPMSEDNGLAQKRYHDTLRRAARLYPKEYDDIRWALEYGGIANAAKDHVFPGDVALDIKESTQDKVDGIGAALAPKYLNGKLMSWADAGGKSTFAPLAVLLLGKDKLDFLYSGVIPGNVLNDFAKSVASLVMELNETSLSIVMPADYLKLAEKELTSATRIKTGQDKLV